MAPPAPLIIAGSPRHVLLRAAAGRVAFGEDRDRFVFLSLLRDAAASSGLRFEGFSLLADRVHLIAIPAAPDSIERALDASRAAYSRYWHARRRPRVRLFGSGPSVSLLDESTRWRALALIEAIPPCARLCGCPPPYAWSSAPAHLAAARPYLPLHLLDWRRSWSAASWWRQLETIASDYVFHESFHRAVRLSRPHVSPQSMRRLSSLFPCPPLPLFFRPGQSVQAARAGSG